MTTVTIIGAGLAGCECAFQLAERGFLVRLLEQKPHHRTPAQTSDHLCELVCSNSLRGAALTNAVGLLKEELRRSKSLILRAADATRVPAGGALAVDRELFSQTIETAIRQHPRIDLESREVTELPAERPLVIATGPLTSDALASELEKSLGVPLAYYDAISPIVSRDSLDFSKIFFASRWGKGDEASDQGDAAYGNAPMNKIEYIAFVQALIASEKVTPRSFENTRYFEGCLPIEVMAERGAETLRHGPMKPMGLTDPNTGRWPYAVVQLRAENQAASAFNLVGFQTRMTYGEQARIFRTIAGFEHAEFLRFGSIHRNTFVHAPSALDESLQLHALPGVYLAGQITGVEGYVESAACGFLCGHFVADSIEQKPLRRPPATTALGALLGHLLRDPGGKLGFQPSNITWAHFAPIEQPGMRLKGDEKYLALAARALADLCAWQQGERP